MDASAPSTAAAARPQTAAEPQWSLRGEIMGGLNAAAVTLPVALSSGLLAYAPFGWAYNAHGALAGILGAGAAGIAVLVARPSFIVSTPRAGVALIQGGLAAALLPLPAFAADPNLAVLAMAIALLLAGAWQVAFGLLRIGHAIKFTPHPVLAGFINGIATLVLIGAVSIVLRSTQSLGEAVTQLTFAAVIVAITLIAPAAIKWFPRPLLALAIGSALYYVAAHLTPGLYLGPTVGEDAAFDMTEVVGFALAGGQTYDLMLSVAPQIIQTSIVLAVVGSLDSLLIVRAAKNMAPLDSDPGRFLVSQGVGNAASAVMGGVAFAAGPGQTAANFLHGGRTRVSGLIAAAPMFLVVFFLSSAVAASSLTVLAALLFSAGLAIFDRWSLRLLGAVLRNRAGKDRRSAYKNLGLVVIVTVITVAWSVTAGLIVGVILSVVMFIVHMSRPLVRERLRCDTILSQRVRPQRDVDILRRDGRRRAVLRLQGVMFFGNTDDLVDELDALWTEVDTIVLDFRRVADIDISAVGALQVALAKARGRKKTLLFCSVPPPYVPLFESFADAEAGDGEILFGNLDKALEWIEDRALRAEGASLFEEIPLEQLEFLDGLGADEIAVLKPYLTPVCFPAGTTLCKQGEAADFMWILSRGSVSVWLDAPDGRPGRRIAALARGTVVGDMSLLEGGTRTATVRADEDVTGYVLDRGAFDRLIGEHPRLATTLLGNIARESARRLRATSLMIGSDA